MAKLHFMRYKKAANIFLIVYAGLKTNKKNYAILLNIVYMAVFYMKIKAIFYKNITIKKRLVISNILMIIVPVVITSFIGIVCAGILWFVVTSGSGLGFNDSEDFYKASRGISMIVEKSLKKRKERKPCGGSGWDQQDTGQKLHSVICGFFR